MTAIVLVAVGASATFGAVSQAAGQPYTAERVCGAGYKQIDRVSLGSVGATYLLYNAGNGHNCVVTLKATSLETRTKVGAYLHVAGQSKPSVDSGQFRYYAGPVRAPAAGKCVKWGGWHGAVRRDMPFGHCGAAPAPSQPSSPPSSGSLPPSVTLRNDYPYAGRSPKGIDPWRFTFASARASSRFA